MSSWPELGEELARKALDTVQRALHDHMVEKTMTKAELRATVNAVIDTIQGLAPKDATEIILQIREEIDRE